jgi:hypothetical protein
MIGVVWLLSFLSNSPLLFVQRLSPVHRGGKCDMKNVTLTKRKIYPAFIAGHGTMKCREVWPSKATEQTYVIFLDIALLVVPLISMGLAYSLIVSKLWRGLRHEIRNSTCQKFICKQFSIASTFPTNINFHVSVQSSPSYHIPNGATLTPTATKSDGSSMTTLVRPSKNTKKSCMVQSSTVVNPAGKKKKKTKTTKDENKQKKATVKFWFFKGFVQVFVQFNLQIF